MVGLDEEAIFQLARQIDRPDARRLYLDQACGPDTDLRARLDALIRAHDEERSFLERPALSPPAPGPETASFAHGDGTSPEDNGSLPAAGTIIAGRYKLLQQIGEGGMGTVYMAEQTHPIQRKVALKIIKPGMDSKQVIARFEAERQALALMDHVNIARVLDAGTTDAGRPYFVMELVHGVPITKYCDDNHLTPRERLELFVPVCQAIQHAHQKGIIHRDIKPSNVLVTLYDGKPVPKVIDFGVAKATEQKLTERTLFTQYGTMVGTLEYMSPEQAEMSALGVDTRSDVYSLGVLLYELLTGSTPLTHKRMKEAAYAEILRMIKEEEPPKPSTRLSDSGEALASISANRHTEPAKLTKLVRGELDWIVMKTLEKDRTRRYETANGFAMDVQRYLADEAVQACPPSAMYRFRKFARRNKRAVATVAIIAAVLLVAVGVVGWAVRDREAREQENARKAERDLALTEQGVRQALEQATKIRDELHAVMSKPGGVQELLNQPGRWSYLIQSAQSELAQGRRLTARSEARVSEELTQALHKLEEDLSGDEADRLMAVRLEKICLDRGTLVDGRFPDREVSAKYAQAFAGFAVLEEDAAAVAARLRSSPISEQLVAALDDWAHVEGGLRNKPKVEQLLAVARQAAPDPAWGDRLRQFKVWHDQEALRKLSEAPIPRLSPQMLALLGQLLSKQSSLRESWLRQAQAQYPADFWLNFRLGLALTETQPLEAAGYYRAAIAIRPTSSAAYNNLGLTLCKQKRLPEAIAAHEKAIALDPKNALAYCGLGNALRDQKRLPEAVAAYRKAIEVAPEDAAAYANLGVFLRDQKKLDEAIAAFRNAIKLDPRYVGAYLGLGSALRDQKKLDEAIAACRKAIELDPQYAGAYNDLGVALRDQKKLDEAIAACRKAIELDPQNARAYSNLGVALSDQKKLPEAVAAYRKAIELDPNNAKAHINLGSALQDQKKLDEAIAACRKAIELDPNDARAYNNLGGVLDEQKKPEEAIAAFRNAIKLDPQYAVPHNNLGLVLREKKPPEAVAAFRRAIEIDPNYAEAYNNLGTALGHQKKWDEAIECFRKALELDPQYALARANLALSLSYKALELVNSPDEKRREPRRAIELTKEAGELAPQSAECWQNLGWVQYRVGDFRASIEALEKSCKLQEGNTGDSGQWTVLALAHARLANQEGLLDKEREHHNAEGRRWFEQADKQIDNWWSARPGYATGQAIWDFRGEGASLLGLPDPGRAAALVEQGQTLRNQKKFAEAEVALREAVRLKPGLVQAHLQLGWVLQSQGKPPEAEAAFREVVRLKPDQAGGHIGLGRTLLNQKKFAEAEKALREGLRLEPTHAAARELLDRALVGQGKPAEAGEQKKQSEKKVEKPD